MTTDKTLVESLLKSGIHWGHQRSRRHPKMAEYVWGCKANTDLLDLYQTASHLERAARFLHDVAAQGKTILWVGTKRPARESVEAAAQLVGMPRVTHRWIGGTLSNFGQVKKSVTKLLHYEDVLAKSESFPNYTKKELNTINKIVERLKKNVGGIRNLRYPIGALVLIDINKEHSALKEAKQVGLPTVALVDTNCDPSYVNYVIPGNDDAPRAIKCVVEFLAQAAKAGVEVAVNKQTAHEEALEAGTASQDPALTLIELQEEEEGPQRKVGGNAKPGVKKAGLDDEGRARQRVSRPIKARPFAGPKRADSKG